MPSSEPVSSGLFVCKRDGVRVDFDPHKINMAITKAFIATEGGQMARSDSVHLKAEGYTKEIVARLKSRSAVGGLLHVEDIQDQVELCLMRKGEHKVARSYVIYRNERAKERQASQPGDVQPQLHITMPDGSRTRLDPHMLHQLIDLASRGLSDIDHNRVYEQCLRNLYDGISYADLVKAQIMTCHTLVERDPSYSRVAARLLLNSLIDESNQVLGFTQGMGSLDGLADIYPQTLSSAIAFGVQQEYYDTRLCEKFDLERLGKELLPERDLEFDYLGMRILYDRYFQHHQDQRFELPQVFFMRVAMGLALEEDDPNARAIEFYRLLSSFDFINSTPTLFNSGTIRSQLSSCYLTTVADDLDGIYSAIKDNALLSKFAGGLGNDWTGVRALGSHIKGTNGKSQGVVPFLKVANDTAVAVNQGGKRKGAVCAYLETWHLDIEDFIELRKNTGDDRRRTHDMNTASWIPDLFMRRVIEDAEWTLFSPNDVSDLHDLTGAAFEVAYTAYEAKAASGEIKLHRKIQAVDLWRKMLGMLFETGHPWITFKDPCNIRYTNQHVGQVHSSNLCTEITLHTNAEEIAVCNLGSVNLAAHVTQNGLDHARLERTVTTAMRMLDNVIDINYYSVPQARTSNLQHRPVGLGIMGFQDALYKLRVPYASAQAVDFADRSMEVVSYYAIQASSQLAKERGSYASFDGSLWSQGILPIDSLQLLATARGDYLKADQSTSLDWDKLRKRVKQTGMRNSNTMAIAPTATISNIAGVSQSIEPTYQNLFVKSNMSGEFTVVNPYMVRDLKQRNLWDEAMINDLKYYDGSLQSIDRIPQELKAIYATAFEIDSCWLVEAAARRQKWLDQAQSLNLYLAEPSGKKLDVLYKLAWVRGLKTTYYLRSLGATHMEKSIETSSSAKASHFDGAEAYQGGVEAYQDEQPMQSNQALAACSILDPDCEACQ